MSTYHITRTVRLFIENGQKLFLDVQQLLKARGKPTKSQKALIAWARVAKHFFTRNSLEAIKMT